MRRIAIINQKGGVGKTTTTANLGAALAIQGRRVVLVDMDAQANLSLALGVEARSGSPTTYSVLTGTKSVDACLRATKVPNLRLLPSNIDLSGAELELASAMGREYLLRDALKEWDDAHHKKHGKPAADYVLFDCPPSLGLLSINALAAAGEVLITLQTEFLALQGMSKLVEIVALLKKRLNPELVVVGIVPTLYDIRLKLAREVLGEIRRYFKDQVMPHPIRANVKLAEAPSFAQTIFEYAPDSNGAVDYMHLAREIIEREARHVEFAGLPGFDAGARLPSTTMAPEPTTRRMPPPRKKKAVELVPAAAPPPSVSAPDPVIAAPSASSALPSASKTAASVAATSKTPAEGTAANKTATAAAATNKTAAAGATAKKTSAEEAAASKASAGGAAASKPTAGDPVASKATADRVSSAKPKARPKPVEPPAAQPAKPASPAKSPVSKKDPAAPKPANANGEHDKAASANGEHKKATPTNGTHAKPVHDQPVRNEPAPSRSQSKTLKPVPRTARVDHIPPLPPDAFEILSTPIDP
jgi:chromosome partitioning protein